MKKITQKILLLAAVIATLVICFAFSASALEETGQCGDNVYWNYNDKTKELVISGEGAMTDYSGSSSPFYNSDIMALVVENDVTSIGNYAFYSCYSLKNVTIGNDVTSIGRSSFSVCYSLTSVTIPNSVTNIRDNAFSNCDSLTSITIPSSVTNIGQEAFGFCNEITSISIGKGVANIGLKAFGACNNLRNIIVDKENEQYSNDEFGVLFDESKTMLIQYPIGNERTSYAIPNSVTEISQSAFLFCEMLKNIKISNM